MKFAAWLASLGPTPGAKSLVSVVIAGFARWAKSYFVKDARPTSEVRLIRSACAKLGTVYGRLPAAEFKPSMLRALRDAWVKDGLARETCNGYTARVVRAFS